MMLTDVHFRSGSVTIRLKSKSSFYFVLASAKLPLSTRLLEKTKTALFYRELFQTHCVKLYLSHLVLTEKINRVVFFAWLI